MASKYVKKIKSDCIDENIEAFGDIIVDKGIFVRGNITANSGNVYIKPKAVVMGDVFATINVFIDDGASVIGTIKAHAIQNNGKMSGIINAKIFKSFKESSGKIKANLVLLGEGAVHEGPIDAICSKIDKEARYFKEGK